LCHLAVEEIRLEKVLEDYVGVTAMKEDIRQGRDLERFLVGRGPGAEGIERNQSGARGAGGSEGQKIATSGRSV
jgi:hypothetical protein